MLVFNAVFVNYFICHQIKVILSDANVPGEGEHKIMNHIRLQRVQDGYPPNVRHVLYGLVLIRVLYTSRDPSTRNHACSSTGRRFDHAWSGHARGVLHRAARTGHVQQCQVRNMRTRGSLRLGLRGQATRDHQCGAASQGRQTVSVLAYFDFEVFVLVSLLVFTLLAHTIYFCREYLAKELKMDNLPFQWDFERIVDDFVFMCFFVGNDFLPHLPSLEIREGIVQSPFTYISTFSVR
jgi:5'-3' exoribonuclease 2